MRTPLAANASSSRPRFPTRHGYGRCVSALAVSLEG